MTTSRTVPADLGGAVVDAQAAFAAAEASDRIAAHEKLSRALYSPHEFDGAVDLRPFVNAVLVHLDVDTLLQPWLVGSSVCHPSSARDFDILLSYRTPRGAPIRRVLEALWCLRSVGRAFRVRIDPFVRPNPRWIEGGPLPPQTRLETLTLALPRLRAQIARGSLTDYRWVGKTGLWTSRRAADTNYFAKLPLRSGQRWLEPARAL